MASKKRMTPEKSTFSVKELAEYLGIGLNAAYNGLSDGSIPSIRVSARKYIVPRAAIQAWLRTAGGKVA